MPLTDNKIDIGFAVLTLVDDWYVKSYYQEDEFIDMKKTALFQKAMETITEGTRLPHLFIAKEGVQIDGEVREYTKSDRSSRFNNSLAIVINKDNLAHRILGNFIVKVGKRPVPTELFTNEKKALHWLSKFKV